MGVLRALSPLNAMITKTGMGAEKTKAGKQHRLPASVYS
jgi:hypothetical protein